MVSFKLSNTLDVNESRKEFVYSATDTELTGLFLTAETLDKVAVVETSFLIYDEVLLVLLEKNGTVLELKDLEKHNVIAFGKDEVNGRGNEL